MLFNGGVEDVPRLFNLGFYLGEVGQSERSVVLLHQIHQTDAVLVEFTFFYFETKDREIIGLLDEFDVPLVHASVALGYVLLSCKCSEMATRLTPTRVGR